jgi:hypothetical protein
MIAPGEVAEQGHMAVHSFHPAIAEAGAQVAFNLAAPNLEPEPFRRFPAPSNAVPSLRSAASEHMLPGTSHTYVLSFLK